MNKETNLIKINGKWDYRGVTLHKDRTKGFTYRWTIRTDKYSQSDCVVPNTLKALILEIDKDIERGFLPIAGKLIKCTRTNCEGN